MDHTNSNLPSITIDVEEKSNNALSQKPSVKSYAARVLQESTVGIVSSIFTTHSKYRRFFKIFLSSLCIAGFVYHCAAFLHHVLGYPEVVNISSDRSGTYIWPAFTYCSNNPIERSVFCSMYPQYCEKPSEEFCKKYSSYCGANATLIPIEKYHDYLPSELEYEWILKLGNSPNVLQIDDSNIRSYTNEEDEITGPYLREVDSDLETRACYNIHSSVESNQQPLVKKTNSDHSWSFSEWFLFYVDETEMINPHIGPGIYFSVHSPFEVVNPSRKEIFLKGGRTYRIYVEMQEEILLKAPFESNCMDYDEFWEKNNRTGPRTKQACQAKCWLDFSIFNYGCAQFYVMYPHKERLCTNETRRKNVSFPLEECLENCRDECRSFKYTTEVSVEDYVQGFELQEQHRYIEVRIYLSDDEVKVLRHSPKYETVDVISSIGGFMGCWLGIALLDILDVFGSIVTVCGYAFRKKLPKKIKRRQSIAEMEKSTE